MMTVERNELLAWCSDQLAVGNFRDFAPNGLQIEGRMTISTIVCAVTASLAAIRYTVDQGADMLLVHHGMFWKSEPPGITGWKRQRIAHLLAHDVNMAGFHLPLDAHSEWGNNACLAKLMGWQIEGRTADQDLLMYGRPAVETDVGQLGRALAGKLEREPLVICADKSKPVRRIAWCTGGGQGFFQAAVDLGADAFVTGEVSEAQYHLAMETGTAFIAAGHHATERYGIQALGRALVDRFGVEVQFFDENNPV